MPRYQNIGIVYHGLLTEAEELAKQIIVAYGKDRKWWLATQDTLRDHEEDLNSSDLILTIGGDGTILRGVHVAASRDIPVLGVNMGRVGFMSDIESKDAINEISWYLDGNARIERRYMLNATIQGKESQSIISLNDVTVARGPIVRVIEVSTVVDGVHLATYRGDGVVVATATGSTGYTLALGGPVMDPASRDFLVKPIATHMSQFGGAILQASSTVELTVQSGEKATLNADGFIDVSLADGETVVITHAGDYASFLRRKPAPEFWGDLSRRLGLRKGPLKSPRRHVL